LREQLHVIATTRDEQPPASKDFTVRVGGSPPCAMF
jgi:hypothetical protein